MKVLEIRLSNFRNYERLEQKFADDLSQIASHQLSIGLGYTYTTRVPGVFWNQLLLNHH